MDDLDDESFTKRHQEILSRIVLYDTLLKDVFGKSNMTEMYKCFDKIVNRYLDDSFKDDVVDICTRNFCVWANPIERRRRTPEFIKNSLIAYRKAILHFMPATQAELERTNLVKRTIEY